MAFKNSTDEKFSEQINGSKLSLIQFSASWCGPCQQLKPIVEKISDDMSDKIDCYYHDIESQNNEPTKYSVRGVPTVLLFKEGKLLGTKVGASSEKICLNLLNRIFNFYLRYFRSYKDFQNKLLIFSHYYLFSSMLL